MPRRYATYGAERLQRDGPLVKVAEEQGGKSGQFIPSPGGWVVPHGAAPGWDWVPPSGAYPRPDLMGRWVRLWYKSPFVDRYARSWLWRHGGFDVLPPNGPERST